METVRQKTNAVKDVSGTSNRVKQTPLETKEKEMMNDERYRTVLAPDTNKVRENRTTELRRKKDVRPL